MILSLCVVVDSALRERLNKIMASDYFTTLPEMKAPAEVADRRELKIRERREMGDNRYNFGIYYFNVLYCEIKVEILGIL